MATAELLAVVGRVLLGALFVGGGLIHLRRWSGIVGVLGTRVPAPHLVLGAGTAFQIVAGTLLAAGVCIVPAALGLVAFTLAASLLMLNFWDLSGPERQAAINQWLTNAGVVGGLLLAAAPAI